MFFEPRLYHKQGDTFRQNQFTLQEKIPNVQHVTRKRIEDAHCTVKVKMAYVLACDVTTMDGSENVGNDCSNIRSATVDVKFVWDGIIHLDGYSVLRLVFDMHSKSTVTAKIIDTDAMVNIEDPAFWCAVGTLLLL